MVHTAELIQAREAAAEVLREMGMAAFLFEVEPDGEEWSLNMECATDGGWATVRIPVTRDDLIMARVDPQRRRIMAAAWRQRLKGCRLGP